MSSSGTSLPTKVVAEGPASSGFSVGPTDVDSSLDAGTVDCSDLAFAILAAISCM